ncbi:hypothetical protein B0H12DRAFT_1115969 [Mycena haematopus]|nr:hypothetical protein B0H12DRAFT_1115969 [Mycena haematopus]
MEDVDDELATSQETVGDKFASTWIEAGAEGKGRQTSGKLYSSARAGFPFLGLGFGSIRRSTAMQSSSSSSHFASFAAYVCILVPQGSRKALVPGPCFVPERHVLPVRRHPYFGASASGGLGAVEEAENQQNQWETRHGLRVDMLAAAAYLLGPISALALLIIETHNDYVRFHGAPILFICVQPKLTPPSAYQSALFTTPLVVIRIFASLLQFWGWLRTVITLVLIGSQLYMAVRAYLDASQNGLARYQLPYIGPIAERWLEEE